MANLGSVDKELNRLEQLAAGDTAVHRLHPGVKLWVTALFLFCVAGMGRYNVSALLPFFFYPVLVLGLGDIPLGLVAKRSLVALPFCLLGCLSNLLLDRAPAIRWGGRVLATAGMVSAANILLRTLLCVSAVLVLAATTPLTQLTGQLRRWHFPGLLVSLVEMVYRYLTLLAQEAHALTTAYQLRSGQTKGVAMKDMGSLVGQLLIRSFDRAQRIYHAMVCRGYGSAAQGRAGGRPLTRTDALYLAGWTALLVLFRWVNVPQLLGELLC